MEMKKYFLARENRRKAYNRQTGKFKTVYYDSGKRRWFVISRGRKEYLTQDNTFFER